MNLRPAKSALATLFACLAVSLGAAAEPLSSGVDPNSIEARREQARVDRLWNLAWRNFASQYIEHDERFICVTNYDPKMPSSTGQSLNAYREKNVLEQTYRDERGRDQVRKIAKPSEEAHAAVALLPEVEPGQYGYIHSGEIADIVDGKTLIMEDVWLVDEEAIEDDRDDKLDLVVEDVKEDIAEAIDRAVRRRNAHELRRERGEEFSALKWYFEDRDSAISRQREREFSRYEWQIVGFRTDRLAENKRWPSGRAAEQGLQLVIVEVKERDRTVTAVPVAAIGRGINELQFLEALEQRQITKPQFVEMVNDAKRQTNDKDEVVAIVLDQLEGKTPLAPEEDADEEAPINEAVELAD